MASCAKTCSSVLQAACGLMYSHKELSEFLPGLWSSIRREVREIGIKTMKSQLLSHLRLLCTAVYPTLNAKISSVKKSHFRSRVQIGQNARVVYSALINVDSVQLQRHVLQRKFKNYSKAARQNTTQSIQLFCSPQIIDNCYK